MRQRRQAEKRVGADADEALLANRDDVGIAREQVPGHRQRQQGEELRQHGEHVGVEQPGADERGDHRQRERARAEHRRPT